MRIACLSDIHANFPALQAVIADIKRLGDDITLVIAGDMINNGPFPTETLAFIRQLNPLVIKGNHEDYVLTSWKKGFVPVPVALEQPALWTASQLSQDDLEWIDGLPDRLELEGPDGWQIIIMHASPVSNQRGIFQFMTDEQLATRFENEPIASRKLYLFGHVHEPVLREWQGMIIAGDGSVGQPLDGNPAACYLLAEWYTTLKKWNIQHCRVEYDRSGIIEAMHSHAAFDQGGPVMKLLTRGFIEASGVNVGKFMREYIAEGSWKEAANPLQHLDAAVERYLADIEQNGVPAFVLMS